MRTLTQAEEWRQQRNNEAKELIGSRVGTAKAIFDQNSASGQMLLNKSAPIKPVRNSIAQRINALNNHPASSEETTGPPQIATVTEGEAAHHDDDDDVVPVPAVADILPAQAPQPTVHSVDVVI